MMAAEEKRLQVAEHSKRQADLYLTRRKFARAFAHYLVFLYLRPDEALTVKDDFVFTLRELGVELEKDRKFDELFKCYQRAVESLPNCEEIQNNLGAHLMRLGHPEEASAYFHQALRINPNFNEAKNNLEISSNSLVERWHFPMLNDFKRNDAFRQAIKRAIENGHDTVMDIGAGTGVLSMYAVENGARQVYAVEMSKTMHQLSVDIVERNNMTDRIRLLNLHSSDVVVGEHVPERVKLLVTETFDCGLLGEGILPTLQHAWQHLLATPTSNAEGGQVIPAAATLWMCMISSTYIRSFTRPIGKFDQGSLDTWGLKFADTSENEPYFSDRLSNIRDGYTFLSKPERIHRFDFNSLEDIEKCVSGFKYTQSIQCRCEGILDAAVVWFDLQLDDSTCICTSDDTCWEQAIYPIQTDRDVHVYQGSRVVMEVNIQSKYVKLTCKSVSSPSQKGDFDVTWSENGGTASASVTLSESASKLPVVSLSKKEMLLLNEPRCWAAMKSALTEMRMTPRFLLLDKTSLPLAALSALAAGAVSHVTLLDSCDVEAVKRVAVDSGLLLDAVKFIDVEKQHDFKWDVVFTNVVDKDGTLKQGCLEELFIHRYQSECRVVPSMITICACVIQSRMLLEINRLVSDERVHGLKIRDSMNLFKATEHLDLSLPTLKYLDLSRELEVLQFDTMTSSWDAPATTSFSSQSPPVSLARSSKSTFAHDGTAHAVAYWFKLKYSDDVTLDTLRTRCYNQAAFILHEPVTVRKDQPFTLNATYSKGLFKLELCL